MNANNHINCDLVIYAIALSFLILFNYFLWSINSWQIIRFINFLILLSIFFYFFVSKRFNKYWYLKIIIFLLLIISLGTPTIPIDSRTLFLFPGKMLFYESNLYFRLDNYTSAINFAGHNFLDTVYSRPKLAVSLSATFAQIVGIWNDIFPRSTNVILIFPPVIFLISFLKDKVLILLWLFFMLFFSGKLLINGLLDGILALYFVASILIVYSISLAKTINEKRLLYFILFLFFTILSLCKHEGGIMILMIFLSCAFLDFLYDKKINYKIVFTTAVSLIPILFWRYIFLVNNSKMEFLHYGDPISRFLSRITNTEDLFTILYFLVINEKLVISLVIFIFFAFKYFNKDRKLILFVSLNFLLYFSSLIVAVLLSTHTVLEQLEQSSVRIFIPLVLMLIYFSIFLIKNNYTFKKSYTLD